jgi:membrane fusion protein (multidrug efflux system)
MSRRFGSIGIVLAVVLLGVVLAVWKYASLRAADAAASMQREPLESVTVAVARPVEHRQTTSSIGTVLAMQSITLRNEVPGTVRQVAMESGQIVEAETVLVALDVTVEEAELRAQQAQAALAETQLARIRRLRADGVAPEMEYDRAVAERDVATANIARTKAVIERKTIRAPFRARVGIADVHPGQYLNEGTQLTTLQSVSDEVHVDFAVTQDVAASLHVGDAVDVFGPAGTPAAARIVAVDARVDSATRNVLVRARIGATDAAAPGASVRVQVPVGPPVTAVAVPISALRKGPTGDHVFVSAEAGDGPRVQLRRVQTAEATGDEVVLREGIAAGERVAASGAFKLYEGARVAIVDQAAADAARSGG